MRIGWRVIAPGASVASPHEDYFMKRVFYSVMIALLAAAVLSACGGEDAASKVVHNYLKAGEAQDWTRANSYLCGGGDSSVTNPFAGLTNVDLSDLKFDSSGSDSQRTVYAQGTLKVQMEQGGTRVELAFQVQFKLRKDNGHWCIDESQPM
jgi:hypothetical protein